jgi:hypothetical protein
MQRDAKPDRSTGNKKLFFHQTKPVSDLNLLNKQFQIWKQNRLN